MINVKKIFVLENKNKNAKFCLPDSGRHLTFEKLDQELIQ